MTVTVQRRSGTTVDQLFDRLRQAVQEGRYAPGQRLIEADLTREYGVSRGPVREALRRLATEGVVDFVPNRGALVKRFTSREILNVFRIRQSLEGLAASLAAEHFRADVHLDEAATLRRIAAGKQDTQRPFSEENREFHNAILRLSDNPQLETLIQQLLLPLVRYQIRGSLDAAYLKRSRREHMAIAKAILANDPKAAGKHMHTHLGHAADRLLGFADLFPNG
ncbi:GntR family transcriptional regulator [Achromobacter aloeverae]|uniref:GntR family transcriptional regulator n=1 Tax=Achromobacter aloeverae TaxID=1750518 RepID=A0A4Q1HGC1_9BURK|nr:GntR family transcriptional regulator [Achromobacter aloeverae]RXN86132.1 GntR family transcriptional regulator [Achromobacter aloeverae]